MKIIEDVDISVTVVPEPGDNPSAAGDFARSAFEALAKKHNIPGKPRTVEHDHDGQIYAGTWSKETKEIK